MWCVAISFKTHFTRNRQFFQDLGGFQAFTKNGAGDDRLLGGSVQASDIAARMATSAAKTPFEARTTAIAYETIRERDGSLPLLTPMSEVAGRMSVQVGAQYLEKPNGGRGILLGGVPGVAPALVGRVTLWQVTQARPVNTLSAP